MNKNFLYLVMMTLLTSHYNTDVYATNKNPEDAHNHNTNTLNPQKLKEECATKKQSHKKIIILSRQMNIDLKNNTTIDELDNTNKCYNELIDQTQNEIKYRMCTHMFKQTAYVIVCTLFLTSCNDDQNILSVTGSLLSGIYGCLHMVGGSVYEATNLNECERLKKSKDELYQERRSELTNQKYAQVHKKSDQM